MKDIAEIQNLRSRSIDTNDLKPTRHHSRTEHITSPGFYHFAFSYGAHNYAMTKNRKVRDIITQIFLIYEREKQKCREPPTTHELDTREKRDLEPKRLIMRGKVTESIDDYNPAYWICDFSHECEYTLKRQKIMRQKDMRRHTTNNICIRRQGCREARP